MIRLRRTQTNVGYLPVFVATILVSALLLTSCSLFRRNEPVNLVIKTNLGGINPIDLREQITTYIQSFKTKLGIYLNPGMYKSELLITNRISEEEMCQLHTACDCFVMPSRGEAFCRPAVDALGFGNRVIATGDKQVGANEDATVTIFEASDATTSTQDKVLLTFVLTQSTVVSLLPLNIIVNEGKFVNGETDNDDVHMNIFGYYIPSLAERTDFRQT